ncbi:hypothetical protein OAN21_00015 [Alphaproteobacteria bacterium]|nr:hypothetical protein [Alphaproteobacteria bacterium]
MSSTSEPLLAGEDEDGDITHPFRLDPGWLSFINNLTDESLDINPNYKSQWENSPKKKRPFRSYLYNSIAGKVRSKLRHHPEWKLFSPEAEAWFWEEHYKGVRIHRKLVLKKRVPSL